MSRVARIVVPGCPHHVTQRGNRQAFVFRTVSDGRAYLRFLKKYCDLRGVSIWAYCLMSNHVHLIAIPKEESYLSKALRDAHTVYGMYFNRHSETSGHVWQGRFYSCPLDNQHLWAAVRYIELNPVRTGIVERAETYRWSSAAGHCGLRDDTVLSNGFPLPGVIQDWATWLHEPFVGREEAWELIRQDTHSGRPCGSSTFCNRIEALLGRDAHPKRRGPKPGTKYQKRNALCP